MLGFGAVGQNALADVTLPHVQPNPFVQSVLERTKEADLRNRHWLWQSLPQEQPFIQSTLERSRESDLRNRSWSYQSPEEAELLNPFVQSVLDRSREADLRNRSWIWPSLPQEQPFVQSTLERSRESDLRNRHFLYQPGNEFLFYAAGDTKKPLFRISSSNTYWKGRS